MARHSTMQHESLLTAATALLDISGVRVGYADDRDVLRDFDLQVHRGEFVSVLGPSGCGKSTVLNVVAGLLPVRDGQVSFLGEPVTGVNLHVGYMTQGDTLLPWRTVFDNVAMPLRLRKVPRAEVRSRVTELLKITDLEQAADRFPSQLSGGMKRRALLARSLIYEPELLLMDEPFAALDAQLRTQMHDELLATVRRTGATVTFITHDVDECVVLSDRVVVVGGAPGQVIASVDIPFGPDRTSEEVRCRPEFVDLVRQLHDHLATARGMTISDDRSERAEAR
ncbi:ABC transporter ATP-binding protein [Streptomyces sp. NPDC055078]